MWFEVFSIYLASRKEAVILISISSERCQTRLQFTGEQYHVFSSLHVSTWWAIIRLRIQVYNCVSVATDGTVYLSLVHCYVSVQNLVMTR